jgi:hypothetical protein
VPVGSAVRPFQASAQVIPKQRRHSGRCATINRQNVSAGEESAATQIAKVLYYDEVLDFPPPLSNLLP